jgi:hypothetical protein
MSNILNLNVSAETPAGAVASRATAAPSPQFNGHLPGMM